jgi:Flp pilus assembly protein TadG
MKRQARTGEVHRDAPEPAPRRGGTRDDGVIALETAVMAVAFIALLGLLVAAGRVMLARGVADSAAHAAAREASLALTPATAQQAADDAARTSMQDSGLRCASTNVSVNTSGLTAPLGQAATVTATVACTVALSDIALPGLPGSKTLTSTFTSAVDPYRSRALGFAHSVVMTEIPNRRTVED